MQTLNPMRAENGHRKPGPSTPDSTDHAQLSLLDDPRDPDRSSHVRFRGGPEDLFVLMSEGDQDDLRELVLESIATALAPRRLKRAGLNSRDVRDFLAFLHGMDVRWGLDLDESDYQRALRAYVAAAAAERITDRLWHHVGHIRKHDEFSGGFAAIRARLGSVL